MFVWTLCYLQGGKKLIIEIVPDNRTEDETWPKSDGCDDVSNVADDIRDGCDSFIEGNEGGIDGRQHSSDDGQTVTDGMEGGSNGENGGSGDMEGSIDDMYSGSDDMEDRSDSSEGGCYCIEGAPVYRDSSGDRKEGGNDDMGGRIDDIGGGSDGIGGFKYDIEGGSHCIEGDPVDRDSSIDGREGGNDGKEGVLEISTVSQLFNDSNDKLMATASPKLHVIESSSQGQYALDSDWGSHTCCVTLATDLFPTGDSDVDTLSVSEVILETAHGGGLSDGEVMGDVAHIFAEKEPPLAENIKFPLELCVDSKTPSGLVSDGCESFY